ncbi:MAG: chromate transporter [Defluviitaleaceae bacterium]|nr:chromate transporter [Defluviitaleaceae bacterium]
MIYLILFWEFFQIGSLAVGGGLAAIPFLFSLADRYPWYTHEMLVNMIAVSEIAPGPIGIKMSTYAGFKAAGVFGSLAATLGLIAPGVIMMLLIVRILTTVRENKYVQNIFYGLRPAVTALIAAAALEIANFTIFNTGISGQFLISIPPLILLALLIIGQKFIKRFSPLMMICVAGIAGIIFRL